MSIPRVRSLSFTTLLDASLPEGAWFLFAPAARRDEFDIEPATEVVSRAEQHTHGSGERGVVVWCFTGAGPRVTLGRSRGKCDVVVDDGRISGLHAALAFEPHPFLVDLSSSNGTFVDGRCLAPGEAGRVRLRSGTVIRLADVELRLFDRDGLAHYLGERRTA